MAIEQIISNFPDAPNSATDTPQNFNIKANNFVSHQANVYVDEVNSWATQANSVQSDINTNASQVAADASQVASDKLAAQQSATDAQNSADAAQQSATDAQNSAGSVDANNIIHISGSGLPNELDKSVAPYIKGFKNLIINGNKVVNQRNFNGTSFVNGEYCWDRWKATSSAMLQIIEDGSYKPNTIYTLSGNGVSTKQITSPSSGNWTLPEVPRTSSQIQLEEGSVATPFEQRPYGLELSLCQRYYEKIDELRFAFYEAQSSTGRGFVSFNTGKRVIPSITYSVGSLYNISSSVFTVLNRNGVQWEGTATNTGHCVLGNDNTAYVIADAEL